MKKDLTELVFILDKSGSMGGLESDTIGGYNAMLAKQKAIMGDCLVTTVLFDHEVILLHDRIDLLAISPLTLQEYQVGGCTALIDALGQSIQKIANVQKHTSPDFQATKVLFIIITDGQENSSREYSVEKVKVMIEEYRSKYSWEFIFLGANIDAVETAQTYGIDPARAQNYHADEMGIATNFKVMSEAVATFRSEGLVADSWSEEISRDYEKRK